MMLEQAAIQMKKNKPQPLPHSIHEIYLKWIDLGASLDLKLPVLKLGKSLANQDKLVTLGRG